MSFGGRRISIRKGPHLARMWERNWQRRNKRWVMEERLGIGVVQCLTKAAMEVIDRNDKLRDYSLVLVIYEFNIPNKAYQLDRSKDNLQIGEI